MSAAHPVGVRDDNIKLAPKLAAIAVNMLALSKVAPGILAAASKTPATHFVARRFTAGNSGLGTGGPAL